MISGSGKFLLIFSICILLVVSMLVYFALHRRPVQYTAIPDVGDLDDIYEQSGLGQLLATKEALKQATKFQITRSGGVHLEATMLAVYLFPDLLADSDFEKVLALELWYPHQQAIERAPKGSQSRRIFEQMRANIWNYENPDRRHPKLSRIATEVIRLFDRITNP